MVHGLFFGLSIVKTAQYDPLAVPAGFEPQILDMTITDRSRKRDIPIRVYLPAVHSPAPIVIFSHGLGGSCKGNGFMGRHFSARGFVTVFIQHPGSDIAVWQGVPLRERMANMRKAAGLENFMLRAKDIPFLIDELGHLNATNKDLKDRMDLRKVGMSGHSFGAVTTQAVAGQWFLGGRQTLTDPRIKAAIAYSPSSPRESEPATKSFGSVKVPWLLMTGTDDVSPIGNQSAESRLTIFPALPAGGKYEAVLYKAEHSAFTDTALPGDKESRNPNHHRVILGLSTAFWEAYLKGDKLAQAWLDGSGPRTIMEAKDAWRRK